MRSGMITVMRHAALATCPAHTESREQRARFPLVLLAASLAFAAGCNGTSSHAGHEEKAHADAAPHWGYAGSDGPTAWGALSPAYALCNEGREQSPIDLRDAVPADRPEARAQYATAGLRIIRQEHDIGVIDNGHTIQVNYDAGSVVQIGDKRYSLVQYHFHAPSEHTVAGQHSPMEMHLVHQSESGELAVAGVLIEEGAHNPAFDAVWGNFPDQAGEEVRLEDVRIEIDALLPRNRQAYRYRGSLTTPPCSEGVSWLVGVSPIELSREQIDAFTSIIDANNRPVQSLGKRTLAIDRLPVLK